MTAKVAIGCGVEILYSDLEGYEEMAEKLRDEFRYANPLRARLKRMGKYADHIPAKIENFHEDVGCLILPRGATGRVEKIFAKHRFNFEYEDLRLDLPCVDFSLGAKAKPIELRPHQSAMVESAIARETCVLRAATGSGKSEVGLEIARRLGRPTLVVVWTSGLVRQWVDRIKLRWGWRDDQIGIIGGGTKRLRPITVALQQSLWKHPEMVSEKFAVVICDEAQRASATTFRDLFSRMPARYRIAMSADERRKDGLEWLIWDHFGPVGYEVTRRELVKKGTLCEVEIVLVPTGTKVDFVEQTDRELRPLLLSERYTEVVAALAADKERNALAASIAGREAKAGRSTIVFCNRVEDGQVFDLARRIAIDEGVPCGVMIGGPSNRVEFESAKARLVSGELKCVVASSAAYQGEDIPRLEVGVVVTPTGSNKQLFEQQVGRLRRTFPGKTHGTMYYLWDENVLPSHRKNLLEWYGGKLVSVEGED